jgi:hypothetical protein
MATKKSTKTETLIVPAPNLVMATFEIKGEAPYVQHKFSAKTAGEMLAAQMEGSRAKNRKKREARNIEEEYKQAQHFTPDGRNAMPASAFRSAMISACRLVGFTMTKAKISIFVEPDSFDPQDGTPLVLIEGTPELHKAPVRLETGVASIAIRPMWREWKAKLRVTYDGDQFRHMDIANLLLRAGLQVGVGEGRPDSKKSHGMGWGTFSIVNEDEKSEPVPTKKAA